VNSPDKLEKLIKKLQDIGTPDKFDIKKLKSLGYTSSNDQRLLVALKFVGLFDDKGVPTLLWKEFRTKPEAAIAMGVKKGYVELFAQYPNAQQKDDEALRTFFSAHTHLGSDAISKVVSTFKTFCRLSKFEDTQPEIAPEEVEELVDPAAERRIAELSGRRTVRTVPRVVEGMTVNLNVQLQLPPDATGEIYDKFFEAMKKHLWPP
jgi:hypothetical protein